MTERKPVGRPPYHPYPLEADDGQDIVERIRAGETITTVFDARSSAEQYVIAHSRVAPDPPLYLRCKDRILAEEEERSHQKRCKPRVKNEPDGFSWIELIEKWERENPSFPVSHYA